MNTENLPGDISLPSSMVELEKLIKFEELTENKYSVEDFFRLPEKSMFKISPDGMNISYLAPFHRRKNIFVKDIRSGNEFMITTEKDRDIEWYMWVNNDRLVYIIDNGGDENYKLIAVNKNGSNLINLTPYENVRIEIIDELEDVDNELIIGMNKNNSMLFEPYRLNIETGELIQLAKNENILEPINSWITDHEGVIRIAIKIVGGVNTTLMYRENESVEFRDIVSTSFKESLVPLFFDFENNNHIYVASNLGRDKSVIIKFDLISGLEFGEAIFSHDEVDVSHLGYSHKRKVLTSIRYTTEKSNYVFLDNEIENIFKFLREQLEGKEIVITSNDKDETKFIVRTFSDRSLGGYYLYEKDNSSLELIADISPWLKEEDMCEQIPLKYISRDGWVINGYITYPKIEDKTMLPVVVIPHGGPWHRDVWGYSNEVQLLANRGFVVFQMNFRGSTGYGRKFWESSFKQWGLNMQNDITDGVNWLIENNIADPDRICIYGGSYGGYATLAGITYTPNLFKAAVDYVGVSNLFTFLNTIPPYWKPYLDMMYEMVGHPEHDSEYLMDSSPVMNIDRIKTPLFVVQGANDPRVNIEESDQIVRTLRKAGQEVFYMVKYDEGHGFRKEENKFEFYKAMLGFMMMHLKVK